VPAAAATPALPSVDHLCENATRRPGELHERLQVDAESLRRVEATAQTARLELGLTVALLVEAALVRFDTAAVAATDVEHELDCAAATARVRRPL
jgi:hypothetical protein